LNNHIKKLISDKRETFIKWLSAGKIEDKNLLFTQKSSIIRGEIHSTHRSSWETFESSLQKRCNKTPSPTYTKF